MVRDRYDPLNLFERILTLWVWRWIRCWHRWTRCSPTVPFSRWSRPTAAASRCVASGASHGHASTDRRHEFVGLSHAGAAGPGSHADPRLREHLVVLHVGVAEAPRFHDDIARGADEALRARGHPPAQSATPAWRPRRHQRCSLPMLRRCRTGRSPRQPRSSRRRKRYSRKTNPAPRASTWPPTRFPRDAARRRANPAGGSMQLDETLRPGCGDRNAPLGA